MHVSYFTPTHDASQLRRVYESLERQSSENWKWVVLANGGTLRKEHLGWLKTVRFADRIEVHDYDRLGSQNIGAIKNHAASLCDGEILAELDHDDEITSNCTDHLLKAFEDPTVDFVYSDCAEVCDDGKVRPHYPAELGWSYRTEQVDGRSMEVCESFPASPASFSRIWYAPNHIRAWRNSFYWKIGGHNHAFDVLDDQELLCRTYIHGNVRHIDKCLYIYHLTGKNTCYLPGTNEKIQKLTLELHENFALQLSSRWSDINKLHKVDICCWNHKVRSDFIGVDVNTKSLADVVADLNSTWPFKDGSVGVVHASDALEHLRDPVHTMSEIYRILAPGGWLISNTPSTDGRGAFQDPTHVSFWNSNSFWYYTRRQTAAYIGHPVRFQAVHINNYFPSQWHIENHIPYVRADLIKLSGEFPRKMTPGRIEI